jgi:predicted ATPase
MHIRHVGLENFRAFQRAEIRLPQAGLVLVAGANNAGKTALLSAFDAVAGDIGDVTSLRYGGSEEPARLAVTFDLDHDERAAVLGNASGGHGLLGAGVLSSVQFVYEQWEDQGLRLRQLSGTWADLGLQPLARMRRAPDSDEYIFEAIDALRQGEPPAADPRVALDIRSEEQRVLSTIGARGFGQNSLEDIAHVGGIAPLWALMAAWRSRLYHFRALRTGTQRSQALSSRERLDPAGNLLTAVLHYLATDRRELFERVRSLIAQVVPGIGILQVRTGGDSMRVVFEGAAGDLNLKDLGTGVEQLLMTLVVGLTETAPLTLLIEEPETNLNPAAQRAMLGLLQEWASDKLIIAATHSPVMLDWSPAGERLWLVTREQETSRVTPVSTDPLPLLDALGVRLSDVLSADRVLLVEGPSDEDVLRMWFPRVLRNPRTAVLRGRGGDNVRHADQLAEWLAGADRAGLRKVLYLRDRDELAPETLARLTRSRSVHVLQRREIENYLLDPAAIATVIGPLTPAGIPAPDAPAIARAMDTAAQDLRQKIIVNRVARRIAPDLPLMDHKLRQQLADSGTDLARFTDTLNGRLMTPDQLRVQIAAAWQEAEADVTSHTGPALLDIAPGEEILNTLFTQYVGTRYDKRVHGPAIAAAMNPPAELADLLSTFVDD